MGWENNKNRKCQSPNEYYASYMYLMMARSPGLRPARPVSQPLIMVPSSSVVRYWSPLVNTFKPTIVEAVRYNHCCRHRGKKGGGGYKTYDVVYSACVTVLHANHIYHALASSGASPMNDNVRALLPGSHVPRTDHHLYLDHRFLLMV